MATEAIDASKPDFLRGDPITGDRYFSPEFAQREWDQMWTRIWHVAGRESQIPEPGDWLVHNIGRESVIVVRQENGGLKAFYNTCMHRGNRLAWDEEGFGSFTCTYHGWKYGPDGVLCEAQDPEDFEGGDPCGRISLVELKCDTWGGFIWYNMDPDAAELAEFLDPIPELTKTRDLDKMVRVVWRTFTVDANWKFASDNFNESYHLPTVHPQLAAITDEDYKVNTFESYPSGHNRLINPAQPSMRSHTPNEVEAPFAEMLKAWDLDPAEFAGRARDGRLALQRQRRKLGPERGYAHYGEGGLNDDELTDYMHHTLFPNICISTTAEGTHFFRTEPDPKDPEKCTFDYWYLHPKLEGDAANNEIWTPCGTRHLVEAEHEFYDYGSGPANGGESVPDMDDSFVFQDISVAIGQQKGFHSRGYRDAILSGQESRIRRFHEVLNDYLEGRR